MIRARLNEHLRTRKGLECTAKLKHRFLVIILVEHDLSWTLFPTIWKLCGLCLMTGLTCFRQA